MHYVQSELKRTQKLYRCKSIIVIFIWRVTRDYPYNPFNSLLEMSFEGIRPKKGFPYFEISLWYSRNNKFWLLKPILNSFKTNFNCVKFSHQMHFIILFGIHKVENKCHDFCFFRVNCSNKMFKAEMQRIWSNKVFLRKSIYSNTNFDYQK